ncbi:MAG: DNA translocase FtsK [Candidatus Omnitrophica bacterium]|nr:DNA translocase FtsK [Candidatus Omnitrophota bacterium]
MKKERINEIVGIVFIAVSIFIFVSLWTHTDTDNPFYTSYPNEAIKNSTGLIGAYISHVLMFSFGLSSYTFPFIFLFWSVSFLTQKVPSKLFFKILGFLIFQSSSSALFSLLTSAEKQFAMGGIWGYLLSSHLNTYFGFSGGLIIAIACFLLSFILATEFLIFPYLSKGFVALMGRVVNIFHEIQTGKKSKVIPDFTAGVEKTRIKKYKQKKEDCREKEDAVEERNIFHKMPKLKVKQYDPRVVDAERVRKQKKAEEHKREKQQTPAFLHTAETKQKRKEERPVEEDKPVVSVFSAHKEDKEGVSAYQFPPVDLLDPPEVIKIEDDLTENSRILESCLKDFDIDVRVTEIEQGPVITRYEILPAPGIKVSRITALQDDIALVMKAPSIRMIAPIPGKAAIGIEVPNTTINVVYLRELLHQLRNVKMKPKLPLVLGKDTSGKPLIADLTEMPHLLIAGATGSGKTVCINSLIANFFYFLTPDQLKFIMIDPKRVELALYNDIPYLLSPVVTDPKKASSTLNWVVNEMENRYKLFASVGVRNIQGYNTREVPEEEKKKKKEEGEEGLPSFLPYIVVIIDELADLMLQARDKVETAITRLAQLSRATGIHLVLATQRPSVDVITGVIKANFPARISFKVSSKTDSRTVLDMNGADKLLGKGDMLFLEPGRAKPTRAQATLISDKEIKRVVEFIKQQRRPEYNESIQAASSGKGSKHNFEKDEMYDEAVRVVYESKQASVSILQRRLRLGYTRAARIIDMMEAEGVVGPYQGSKPRELLYNNIEDEPVEE